MQYDKTVCASAQFPGHSELLWGEAKGRGERGGPGLHFHALVRVLQRLQERLDTPEQEHLQREVSRVELLCFKAG